LNFAKMMKSNSKQFMLLHLLTCNIIYYISPVIGQSPISDITQDIRHSIQLLLSVQMSPNQRRLGLAKSSDICIATHGKVICKYHATRHGHRKNTNRARCPFLSSDTPCCCRDSTTTSCVCPHDRCTATCRTNTPSSHRIRSYSLEHRCILQHIRHDEESDHTSPDVYLIQLRHPSIPASDGDVLQ